MPLLTFNKQNGNILSRLFNTILIYLFSAHTLSGFSQQYNPYSALSKITDSQIELHIGGSTMSTQIARKVIERMHTGKSDSTKDILSPRENEILQLLAKGLLYKEISDQIDVTTGSVRPLLMLPRKNNFY